MPSLCIMCVFWRVLFFYVLGSLAIGVTVSSDNPNLTTGGVGAKSSPWVIAIQSAGIPALPFHQCCHFDICLFVGWRFLVYWFLLGFMFFTALVFWCMCVCWWYWQSCGSGSNVSCLVWPWAQCML